MTAAHVRLRRVLMTADTVGGVWTYALDLARGLCLRGMEVGLATMGARLTPDQWSEAASVPGLRIFESEFRLEWMADPWGDVEQASAWLLNLENEFAPHIVHLNGYAHGALAWRAPRLVVGHSCVCSWWRAVKGEDAPSWTTRYREAVTAGLRAANMVVAPSRCMMGLLQRYYGPFHGATAVIPNGSSIPRQRPVAKEPLVFAAGRLWDEAKNIGAVAELSTRIDWPVALAGDASDPEGRTIELENVTVLGRLPRADLGDWYGRAAIYCLPARYEPFGLSVLEAALSNCALVLGDIPSLRENWDGYAVFAEPNDIDELTVRVAGLIRDNARRNALSAKAKAHALTLTPDRMTEQYTTLYRQMIASSVEGTSYANA